MKKSRIVIVGVGAVGSTTAYTLLLKNRVDELVLIDANQPKAQGDALDMSHGMPFIGATEVWAGTYEDCKDADIIIITAGAAQKPGENRIDLMSRNAAIFDSIMGEICKYNHEAILLIASNPVDIMTYYIKKKYNWPTEKLIGSGTVLDSARFRYLIGEKLNIHPKSIHAHIVGEHGDSSVPLWSLANVAGNSIDFSEDEKLEIHHTARDAAYEIINAKGATYYAIAVALDKICDVILHDEATVLSVSTYLEDYHGISGLYLSVPCIVDKSGIREVLGLQISDEERILLQSSASKLKKSIGEYGLLGLN